MSKLTIWARAWDGRGRVGNSPVWHSVGAEYVWDGRAGGHRVTSYIIFSPMYYSQSC